MPDSRSGGSIDVADLRNTVEPLRKGHDLEGNMGEFIVPNDTLYRRENKLYADVEAYEDGTPVWNVPVVHQSGFPPLMLAVAQSCRRNGRLRNVLFGAAESHI